jgi:hypothetical protein
MAEWTMPDVVKQSRHPDRVTLRIGDVRQGELGAAAPVPSFDLAPKGSKHFFGSADDTDEVL